MLTRILSLTIVLVSTTAVVEAQENYMSESECTSRGGVVFPYGNSVQACGIPNVEQSKCARNLISGPRVNNFYNKYEGGVCPIGYIR
jgi:hypothetical protein